MSFVSPCDTQPEIDYYWERLPDGGEESMCGWLHDRFGVSWQVVPSMLGQLLGDPEKGQAAMQAMFQMKKLDIATLLSV